MDERDVLFGLHELPGIGWQDDRSDRGGERVAACGRIAMRMRWGPQEFEEGKRCGLSAN